MENNVSIDRDVIPDPVLCGAHRTPSVDVKDEEMGVLDEDPVQQCASEVNAEIWVVDVAEGKGLAAVLTVEVDATNRTLPVVACPVGATAERAKKPNGFS